MKRTALLALCCAILFSCAACEQAPSSSAESVAPSASEPAVESDKPAESAQKPEDVDLTVDEPEDLEKIPQFTELVAAGENVTSFRLAESKIDAAELRAFMNAYETGGSGALEIYSFGLREYEYYHLKTDGGTVGYTGWQKSYKTDEVLAEWDVSGIEFMEMKCDGILVICPLDENDECRETLELYVYNKDVEDEAMQVYRKYMKALEWCSGLRQEWDADTVELEWGFYFEDLLWAEDGVWSPWEVYAGANFPAEDYERAVLRHFPITSEQIRALDNSGYNAADDTYYYDGGRGGLYLVTTRVLEVQQADGLLTITYSNDKRGFDSAGNPYYIFERVNGRPQIPRGDQKFKLIVRLTDEGFEYVSNHAI